MVEVIQALSVTLTVHEASVVREAETDASLYAVIKINGTDHKTKSVTSSQPIWSEIFDLMAKDKSQSMAFEVRDNDKLLGKASVNVWDLVSKKGRQEIKLSGKVECKLFVTAAIGD